MRAAHQGSSLANYHTIAGESHDTEGLLERGREQVDLSRNIKIRPAEPRDSPAIASLLADAFSEYRPLYTSEGYSATAITSPQVEERIREGPLWVALSNEMVVGTVSVIARKGSLYVREWLSGQWPGGSTSVNCCWQRSRSSLTPKESSGCF
jgi:hypothetical protein